MKHIFQRIGTAILAVILVVGIVLEPGTTLKVSAASSSGIKNNGTGGIYIDINSAPYTTFQNYSWGEYAYTSSGCAWFASARVNQLTGNMLVKSCGNPGKN